MSDYPQAITQRNHVAPAPRRVRGFHGGETIFDTTRALYVWEWPQYPQYYIPRADVHMNVLRPDGDPISTPQGDAQVFVLEAADIARAAARLIVRPALESLNDTVRFEWDALDNWFEEDEEVFVHPRSPYTRVDTLRSTRTIRIELDGAVLAQSSAPVMLFETGLPTRYYLDQSAVHFEHLVPSQTRTACPYKGRTTGYWHVAVHGKTRHDIAWLYAFPTRQVQPIAGLVAFLNEKVDVFVDDVKQPRPLTHMGDAE
jgi:uncharacterized protein (DUF427 family)